MNGIGHGPFRKHTAARRWDNREVDWRRRDSGRRRRWRWWWPSPESGSVLPGPPTSHHLEDDVPAVDVLPAAAPVASLGYYQLVGHHGHFPTTRPPEVPGIQNFSTRSDSIHILNGSTRSVHQFFFTSESEPIITGFWDLKNVFFVCDCYTNF